MQVRFHALLVAGLISLGMINSTSASNDPEPPLFSYDEIAVGDVIAVGEIPATSMRSSATDDICTFTEFGVQMKRPAGSEAVGVAVELDEGCQLVVTYVGSWDNMTERFLGAPTPAINPQTRAAAAVTATGAMPEVGVPTPSVDYSALLADEGNSDCPTGQETVTNWVWMFGYGGYGDHLTEKFGDLTYSYQKCIVWISGGGGSCDTNEPWWKIDQCVLIDQYSTADEAWHKGRGNFHCEDPSNFPCNSSDPDGYYHYLKDEEYGYADGDYECRAYYSGEIVWGVWYGCGLASNL